MQPDAFVWRNDRGSERLFNIIVFTLNSQDTNAHTCIYIIVH